MRHHARTAVGIVLSLLLLAWVLRDVSAQEVLHELRNVRVPLFAAAILVAIAGFAVRALRWGLLLLPAGYRPSFRFRYAATIVGFAANNVLPARVGEFARAFALTRLSGVPLAAAFASLVVERLFDGLVVVVLLFAAMASPSFPMGDVAGVDPRAAARVMAVVMGAAGVGLGMLVVMPERVLSLAERVARVLPDRWRSPALGALRAFLAGLAVLRSGPLFAASLLLATGQWLFTALSFLLAFRAFGITEVGLAGAVFLQSLIALAVAVPSSPGFFGPFEAAARVGLAPWGVAADKAVSFAVGLHLGGFLPVTLMGIYYVWRLNLRWREVSHSEEVVEEQLHTRPLAGAPRRGD